MTETWLREDDNEFSIAEICPTGYHFYHVTRKNARGGGVGLLLKKYIKVKKQSQRKFSSFEYIDVTLNCRNTCTRMIVIYRPPPSKTNKLSSSIFLIILPGNILMAGDFNFYIDNIGDSATIKESFNLQQHVNGPTHKKGHTLDLIITRNEDKLVTGIRIHDPVISDHLAIHCTLQLEKPPLEQAEIYYRKLNNVNMDSFNEDIKVLDLNDDYDLSVLIDKYENTLKETLQQHAPQKRRIITPLSPWYNEEIGQEKRNRRKLERRWRASGLCIDRQLYVKQCERVNAMIKNAKTTYYSSVISSNAHNQKVLFSTVDKLLHRKPEKRYPTASSTTELVNKFADFFSNKIAIIWKELAIDSSHCNQRNQEEQYAQCVKFINFQEVTEHEIENVIDKVGKKSCELDPVPAKIFQGCQKTLLPIITKISNKSLQSGCMPEKLKEAVLKPKLKKDSLEYEEYTNFRPISNLKFLSKVIEKVAAGQLLEHLANNNLEEPFQSAYKRFHSAETTLLKVQNDILVAIDNRKCVVLLLLDMSAAFDTVDHELLLQRMFKRFGIDGQVLKWFQSYLQNRTQSVVIDDLNPLHPKNKILLYNRYVLSKLSWHLTITSISKTWISKNLDSLFTQYVRKWLEVPISGTLSNIYLTSNKFGLNIIPPSTKFLQCQVTIRNALKSSSNESIIHLWKSTTNHTNIQYDQYSSTKEVIKSFRDDQVDKLTNQLTYQGSFFTSVSRFSLTQVNTIWPACQSKLPKNIFNFTIRYINNSLPTRRNLQRWGLYSSSECSFCINPESLLHVVAGCSSYLDRFTWRHDSILNFIANNLPSEHIQTIYADLSSFSNPSTITGDDYRSDLLILTKDNCLYILELTVGYETNLRNNVNRKYSKYKDMIMEQKKNYHAVNFINLSISALGVFDKESSGFIDMLEHFNLDKAHVRYVIKKIINIAIRSTYYIFCCRNKNWVNPDLMKL
ncbi:Hypothetical predicted protein [Paramuricea clavata]|uniref:Uncharacterized protein n=1 Tax=Paramuricea clavata TaxID=317549 RepID=A0A7D9J8W4_PARCT|nr:Hypothetical predicted protein [Paramuricea clavata]